MTVSELIEQLKGFPLAWTVSFGDQMRFNRVKKRGPKLIDIELRPQVFWDGKQWVIVQDDPPPPRET
jgi:hypothetical protein